MRLTELSAKSRTTIAKIARAKGITEGEVLRHIESILHRRKMSKHSRLFC